MRYGIGAMATVLLLAAIITACDDTEACAVVRVPTPSPAPAPRVPAPSPKPASPPIAPVTPVAPILIDADGDC